MLSSFASLVTLTLALTSFTSVTAQDTSLADVVKAFDTAKIPANLHLNFNPTSLLNVTFTPRGAAALTVKAGLKVARGATATIPSFRLTTPVNTSSSEVDVFAQTGPYVIAMIDPDSPTPQNPYYVQVRHYLGGGWVQNDGVPLTTPTKAVTDWFQPTPQAGSDAHRYVFLVYKQSSAFATQTLVTPSTSIANFNITQFATSVGLGDPIAGTFMMVSPA